MSWNAYSADQGPAQISPAGWNHLHLVVAGQRMAVYVNRLCQRALTVDLRSDPIPGGLAFKGPAIYANLVVTPGYDAALAGERDAPAPPGTIIDWSAARPTLLPFTGKIADADIPPDGNWQPIAPDARGLVDLQPAFVAAPAPAISVGWLRSTITEARPARRTLLPGWVNGITVFLNGKRVLADTNAYFPVARRLAPDGRLAADNASIPLDLKVGRNVLVLAVDNRWKNHANPYGWAAEARLDVARDDPAN